MVVCSLVPSTVEEAFLFDQSIHKQNMALIKGLQIWFKQKWNHFDLDTLIWCSWIIFWVKQQFVRFHFASHSEIIDFCFFGFEIFSPIGPFFFNFEPSLLEHSSFLEFPSLEFECNSRAKTVKHFWQLDHDEHILFLQCSSSLSRNQAQFYLNRGLQTLIRKW